MALKKPGVEADVLFRYDRTSLPVALHREDPVDHEEGRRRQSGVEMFRRVLHQGSVGEGKKILQAKAASFEEFPIRHHGRSPGASCLPT